MLSASLVLFCLVAPTDLVGHVASRIGDSAVIAGGWADNQRSPNASVWIYILGSKTWKTGSNMPTPRGFAAAASTGSEVVVIGGIDASGAHSQRVEAYDPGKNRWEAMANLPRSMSRAAACFWQGSIYVSGGFNGTSESNAANSGELYRLDLKQNRWHRLASMSVPRHGHCLVPFANRLWAIGGHGSGPESEQIVESYDPAANSWRFERSLPYSRGFFGAANVGGKLVVFGGSHPARRTQYWTAKGWVDRPAPDIPRRRFGFVLEVSEAIIFGGEEADAFVFRFKL